MAMRTMYKHNKRKKEMSRQKKKEEKRLKRQNNAKASSQDSEGPDSTEINPESSGDTTEAARNIED